MAEEEPKKKRGVVKKILKWFGLGVLGLLIVLGLIFQAPWKVMALLVVFLLAHTVLPRPGLKWFWAGVGVVVIALIIWVFMPEDDTGWRPYTFDEELAALEAKRAIPDEENAARIYNELLGSYDSNSFYAGLEEGEAAWKIRSEPWKGKDHPEMQEWLSNHEETIASLLEVAQIEKCSFPIMADLVKFQHTLERFATMRRWAYLLVYAANNDLGEGRINPALEKYFAGLQMGKHMYQQTTLVEMLVGIAIENLSLKQLNRLTVTEDITKEHLWIIENAINQTGFDWNIKLPELFENEKLITKNTWVSCYEVNKDGRVRLTRNLAKAMAPLLPKDIQDETVITYAKRKFIKASMILLWFYMPSNPKAVGEIVDEAYEKHNKMLNPDYDWSKEPGKYSIDKLLSFRLDWRRTLELSVHTHETTLHKIHDIYLRTIADKRASLLIIASRRYQDKTGRWPESLDQINDSVEAETLIDPINGDSFVYKLTPENFTLYSKGKNNIDEDGEYDTVFDPNSFETKVNADDRLFWPPRKGDCEPEEENADDEKQ
jgi:hypothetical protein